LRTSYITGIVLSIAASVVFFRYGTIIAEYRPGYITQSPLVPQYAIDQVYRDQVIFFTRSVAIISMVYFLFHICLYSYTVIKKIPGISPGLPVFCIVILLGMSGWDVMMYFSPAHISFDEVYFAWIAVALILIFINVITLRRIGRVIRHDDPDILDSGIGD